uniref:Uncharacterized protein n=1 Tax=Anguilla anguilla TaxID=7936 RepID=A0A0E9X2F8_ANGAN
MTPKMTAVTQRSGPPPKFQTPPPVVSLIRHKTCTCFTIARPVPKITEVKINFGLSYLIASHSG